MDQPFRIFIGWDRREPEAYDVAKFSLERRASIPVEVTPIATSDYPTPARRPSYSVLDKSSTTKAFGLNYIHWRNRLRAVIEELRSA